jgi:hypothetical protein
LFVGRWGDRLSQRNVQLLVVYWAKRQGLALHVHLHMFRHSCAMHVLERCQDIRAVQELLGNASISTTAIYTHLDFEHLMTVYRKAHPHAVSKAASQIRANAPAIATEVAPLAPAPTERPAHQSRDRANPIGAALARHLEQ